MAHVLQKEDNTLCSKLYDILSKSVASPEHVIANLTGTSVFIGKNQKRVRVSHTDKRTVYYEMVQETSSIILQRRKKKGSINVHCLIDTHKSPTEYMAFPREPSKIMVDSGYHISISFQRHDSNLEEILKRGVSETKPIQSEGDLKKLANWVYKSRKYEIENLNSFPNIDFWLSIGKVWKEYGAVCRHFSGVAYALLLLQNIDAKLVSSNKEIVKYINSSHAFLEVTYNKKTYVVDPIWNFVAPAEDLIKKLRKIKKETLWHQDYQPMRLIPWYKI